MRQRIFVLLFTYQEMLEGCYKQVFGPDTDLPAIKSFKDYFADFYLHLLKGKPKFVDEDVEGYYILQIKDEKAIAAWLRKTFKNFLLDEQKVLKEMQDALKEYKKLLLTHRSEQPLDITIMHVAFALAWFNQHESEVDRYLFYRGAYKHFNGFYYWPPRELKDDQVAEALGITEGALRTRTSRLCEKVRRLVHEMNDTMISTLDCSALKIAKGIYENEGNAIESILKELLNDAEHALPQYEKLCEMREENKKDRTMYSSVGEIGQVEGYDSSVPSLSVLHEIEIKKSTARDFDYLSNLGDSDILCSAITEPVIPYNRVVQKFKKLVGL